MPRAKKAPPSKTKVTISEIQFHMLKSNFFRVVQATGAVGGITPQGFIRMCLYNERGALPTLIVNELKENKLGVEIRRETRPGIVRELEVDVSMDETAATALHQWLGEKIEMLKNLKNTGQKGKKK